MSLKVMKGTLEMLLCFSFPQPHNDISILNNNYRRTELPKNEQTRDNDQIKLLFMARMQSNGPLFNQIYDS